MIVESKFKLFSKLEIDAMRGRIFAKPTGAKPPGGQSTEGQSTGGQSTESRSIDAKPTDAETQYVRCLVRGSPVRLTQEEMVRQLWLQHLVEHYGYEPQQLRVEYPIVWGSNATGRADIVVMDLEDPTTPYIILEVKKPNAREGKRQLHSYANSTGAPLAVWSDGSALNVWNRRDPNYFIQLPALPTAGQTIADVTDDDWTIRTLEALSHAREEQGRNYTSLRSLIVEMEDEVLSNAGVDVFEEVFKLIFTKLYDEALSTQDKQRPLQFRNRNTAQQLLDRIHKLFAEANRKWPGVFSEEVINLEPSHLQVCVGTMESWKLFNANLDIVDNAFEYLVTKSSKGEKGQFFTPRWVVDMCVKMLDPKVDESMIDPACGSAGFALHTIFHVWNSILQEKYPDEGFLAAESKPAECINYVRDKVIGIDFDEKCVRAARCLNIIAGDGESNILHLNALDWGRWKGNAAREEWADVYAPGWSHLRRLRTSDDYKYFGFDVLLTNPPFAGNVTQGDILANYNLAIQGGKVKRNVERDALFVERNIDLLAPGGRMAIVLPLGRFNNATSSGLRAFVLERCRVLAVVDLDGQTFVPHTATKTAILFVQKWNEDPNSKSYCPKVENYDVFMAEQQKGCVDGSGNRIIALNENGGPMRDSQGRYLIDHDLFGQEGLAESGIAESFQAFAFSQGLSFASETTSAASAVNAGTVVELRDMKEADRWDAKFYRPEYLDFIEVVQRRSPTTVKVGDICVNNGRGAQPLYDANGEVSLISSRNIRQGWLDFDGFKRVSRDWYDKNPSAHVFHGDILTYTTGKYIGRTAVYLGNEEAAANNHVNILRLKDGYDPEYVAFIMNSAIGRTQTMRFVGGGGQGELYPKNIAKFVIPIVSDAEMSSLVAKLNEADKARRDAVRLMAEAGESLGYLTGGRSGEDMAW